MTMCERADARWKTVECRQCGKRWRCTPEQDYFDNTTLCDGLCWDCLLAEHGETTDHEPAIGEPIKIRKLDNGLAP